MTYFLRTVEFGPLQSFVSFEDRLYAQMFPSSPRLIPGFRRIIFLDVDDRAIEKWDAASTAAVGTPRALLARIVHLLRVVHASVIFLDYDLRSHLVDDPVLRDELAKTEPGIVLLPKVFQSERIQQCEMQLTEKAPFQQETAFDDSSAPASVASVHSVISIGSYGVIDGICSFYWARSGERGEIVRRTSAMVRALEIVQREAVEVALPGLSEPRLLPIRWWVNDSTPFLTEVSGKLAYSRVSASFLIGRDAVSTEGADLSALDDAIVIVSSTHRWSGDFHETPVGSLPGALVHANLGLQLQSYPESELPLTLQFLIDVALLALTAIATIPLCWLPAYRRMPHGKELAAWTRVVRLLRECLVIGVFGLMLFAAYFGLAVLGWNGQPGWRFGLLSFLLSAVVVLMIELVAVMAESATRAAEAAVGRLSPGDLGGAKAADQSAGTDTGGQT